MSQSPGEPFPQPSSYQVDAENIAEMARLIRQARMLSNHLGLLPAGLDLSAASSILDIGCGPGEWALDMAQRHPASQITGIDISERMIAYAQHDAQARKQALVHFQVMDARESLAFPDASFGAIHARFITGFLSTALWPKLMRECFRLLRPGGWLISTEFEDLGVSTSAALAAYNHLLVQAARQAGQCFSPAGDHYGITAVQHRLFQDAGFRSIHQQAYSIDYSAGMPAHTAMGENFRTFLKLVQLFLMRSGVTTQDDIESLYARLIEEMDAGDFFAVAYFQRVWGAKPQDT